MAGPTTTAAVKVMVPVVMAEDTARLTISVREILIVEEEAAVNRPLHNPLAVVVEVSHL